MGWLPVFIIKVLLKSGLALGMGKQGMVIQVGAGSDLVFMKKFAVLFVMDVLVSFSFICAFVFHLALDLGQILPSLLSDPWYLTGSQTSACLL